ncbi:MAG: hypothetical protein D6737_19775 [Chloroflexi bacterium]|nr:MAG: hypothetical protein D6737_19775 [Chloroflexota bacterium]
MLPCEASMKFVLSGALPVGGKIVNEAIGAVGVSDGMTATDCGVDVGVGVTVGVSVIVIEGVTVAVFVAIVAVAVPVSIDCGSSTGESSPVSSSTGAVLSSSPPTSGVAVEVGVLDGLLPMGTTNASSPPAT